MVENFFVVIAQAPKCGKPRLVSAACKAKRVASNFILRFCDSFSAEPATNSAIFNFQFDQARKRNPNPNLVRISSGGVGFFAVKGWGPKSSVCPSKPGETKLFDGISRGFWRDILGVPEKLEKKKFLFNFRALFEIAAVCDCESLGPYLN